MTIKEKIENLKYLISDDCTDTQVDYIEEIESGISALENQKLYEHLYFQIGEALVDVSKCDISPEYCIEKIRNAMKEFDYVKNRSEEG